MTDWELQQVTDTLVMAHQKDLMPTISRMLSALSGERRELLAALRDARMWIDAVSSTRPELQTKAVFANIDAAIDKAES